MKIVVEVKTKYKSQPLLSGQISTTKRDKWKYLQPTKESRTQLYIDKVFLLLEIGQFFYWNFAKFT